MNNSEITFREISKYLDYIKVYWNGELVYDDMAEDFTYDFYSKFRDTYDGKKIYKVNIEIVEFHHCILSVEGEA